jgi:hypothetical protein
MRADAQLPVCVAATLPVGPAPCIREVQACSANCGQLQLLKLPEACLATDDTASGYG